MSPKFHIVIPARMESQRLPGKPLLDLAGQTMIERVYRRAAQADAESVVIATDSKQIFELAKRFGAMAVMTSKDHQSGSDRIAECAVLMKWAEEDIVVNLQGDEPEMPPLCLQQAAQLLADHPQASVASLYQLCEQAEADDPNVVKVVTDVDGYALYFSRSPVPFPRDGKAPQWKRHIGLYAYRVKALTRFSQLPSTPLECSEKLEQLRFLESGLKIVMAAAASDIPAGIDTPEDLRRVLERLTAE